MKISRISLSIVLLTAWTQSIIGMDPGYMHAVTGEVPAASPASSAQRATPKSGIIFTQEDEDALKKLQNNKSMPVFPLAENDYYLSEGMYRPWHEYRVFSDTNKQINLRMLVSKTALKIGAISPLPDGQLLDGDSLAFLYAAIIKFNDPEGQRIVDTYPYWSPLAPRSFVDSMEHYLTRKDLQDDGEDFALAVATNRADFSNTTPDTRPIDRHLTLFHHLLTQPELTQQDKKFITSTTEFYLGGLLRDTGSYDQAYRALWKNYCLTAPLKVLNRNERGRAILEEIIKNHQLGMIVRQKLQNLEKE